MEPDIRRQVMDVLDRLVRNIGKDEYLEALEEIGGDIDVRIECVKQEMEDS